MLSAFARWCQTTWIANRINASIYAMAILGMVHIVGLTVLLGAVLMIDLRLLGFGLRTESPARIAEDVGPWMLGGLLVMLGTGIPMFLSQAVHYTHSTAFFTKMALLPVAAVLQLVIYRKTTRVAVGGEAPAVLKLAASLSLVAWAAVAFSGRAIAFDILFEFSTEMFVQIAALAALLAVALAIVSWLRPSPPRGAGRQSSPGGRESARSGAHRA